MPAAGGLVTFAPGARSAWHTHPAGQLLIVTSGTGWVQEDGGAKREIKPGDVIWTPPGVKHWHGASTTKSDESNAHTTARTGSIRIAADQQLRTSSGNVRRERLACRKGP